MSQAFVDFDPSSLLLALAVGLGLGGPAQAGTETPAVVPAERGEAAQTPPGAAAPEELRLDGVIVAQDPGASIALVRHRGDARARVLRIGDVVAGYALSEVTRGGVRLIGPEGALRLELSGGYRLDPAAAEARRESGEREGWERRSFPKEGSRARLEKEMGVILADTTLEPVLEEGEVRGLELLRLPDGTLLSESGLLPGDVLLSLNEAPLVDLDALWETLAHLDGEDELRLVVERRGRVLRLAYDLDP